MLETVKTDQSTLRCIIAFFLLWWNSKVVRMRGFRGCVLRSSTEWPVTPVLVSTVEGTGFFLCFCEPGDFSFVCGWARVCRWLRSPEDNDWREVISLREWGGGMWGVGWRAGNGVKYVTVFSSNFFSKKPSKLRCRVIEKRVLISTSCYYTHLGKNIHITHTHPTKIK